MLELMISGTLPLQDVDNDLRNTWMLAIRDGNINLVKGLIKDRDVSASLSPNCLGTNPLIFLLSSDNDRRFFEGQADVAQLLIESGCELHLPDLYKMRPADYGMISSNIEAATVVVRETIVRGTHLKHDYIPNVDGYFATVSDSEERRKRFNNLLRNHEEIRETFKTDINYRVDPKLEESLSMEQMAYWGNPPELKYKDMPEPSKTLTDSMKLNGSFVMAIGVNDPKRGDYYEEALSYNYGAHAREIQSLKP